MKTGCLSEPKGSGEKRPKPLSPWSLCSSEFPNKSVPIWSLARYLSCLICGSTMCLPYQSRLKESVSSSNKQLRTKREASFGARQGRLLKDLSRARKTLIQGRIHGISSGLDRICCFPLIQTATARSSSEHPQKNTKIPSQKKTPDQNTVKWPKTFCDVEKKTKNSKKGQKTNSQKPKSKKRNKKKPKNSKFPEKRTKKQNNSKNQKKNAKTPIFSDQNQFLSNLRSLKNIFERLGV